MKLPRLIAALFLATMLPIAMAQTAPATTTTASPTTTPTTTSDAPKVEVPAEVKKMISDSIPLLEAGKIEEAVAILAGPAAIAEWKSDGSYDDVITRVKMQIPEMIKMLKAAQTATPSVTSSQVRYDPVPGIDRPLTFNHTKDGWQLK